MTEQRGSDPRGVRIAFTGQELSLSSGKGRERERERRCTPVLEEGWRKQRKGAVEVESRGEEGRSITDKS